jgi:hypothetical protein
MALLLAGGAVAQELTPRAYWPTPDGTNVLAVAYQFTTGDIVTDPSLPLTGVDSTIDYFLASYQRTFNFSGRTATLQLSLPFARGDTEGLVEGEYRRRDVSGMGDTRLRFAVNLKGAPSMDRAGFQALLANPEPIIGASVILQFPTGQYDADKYINLGANRWALKPAIGFIWPFHRRWMLEAEVGAWIFGDNEDFVGQTREQEPIVSMEAHLISIIRRGIWASLDANYYVGGKTTVDNIERGDLQRNSRFGATVYLPFRLRHAVRMSWSTGVVTESGGDFTMVALSYVYVW